MKWPVGDSVFDSVDYDAYESGAGMVVLWSLPVTSDGVTIQWTGEPYVSELRCAELCVQHSRLFDDDDGFVDVAREWNVRQNQHSRWHLESTKTYSEDQSDSDTSASGYWTPEETVTPNNKKIPEGKEAKWWEGMWNAWSVPRLLLDSMEEQRTAMADLTKVTCLPIWMRHRYESEDLGQYYYQEQ